MNLLSLRSDMIPIILIWYLRCVSHLMLSSSWNFYHFVFLHRFWRNGPQIPTCSPLLTNLVLFIAWGRLLFHKNDMTIAFWRHCLLLFIAVIDEVTRIELIRSWMILWSSSYANANSFFRLFGRLRVLLIWLLAELNKWAHAILQKHCLLTVLSLIFWEIFERLALERLSES